MSGRPRVADEPLTIEQAEVVEANLGLVWHVINRTRVPLSRQEDAFQDGIFGLAKAARGYDPDRGFTFSTYAFNWIRQTIQRGRGDFEGANFRAYQRGTLDSYARPASFSAMGPDGEFDLTDLIPAGESAESVAVRRMTVSEMAGVLRSVASDAMDHAIADRIISGSGDTNRVMGERFGVREQSVQIRHRRLVRRARSTLGDREVNRRPDPVGSPPSGRVDASGVVAQRPADRSG